MIGLAGVLAAFSPSPPAASPFSLSPSAAVARVTCAVVARDESVCWQLGQSKHLLQRFFFNLASDDGMFSKQLQQKCESTYQ